MRREVLRIVGEALTTRVVMLTLAWFVFGYGAPRVGCALRFPTTGAALTPAAKDRLFTTASTDARASRAGGRKLGH